MKEAETESCEEMSRRRVYIVFGSEQLRGPKDNKRNHDEKRLMGETQCSIGKTRSDASQSKPPAERRYPRGDPCNCAPTEGRGATGTRKSP